MSTTQAATTDSAQQGTGKRRIVVVVAATVATVVVWLLAHSAFGVDLKAKTGSSTTTVSLPAVIVVMLIVGFLAWGLLALLTRKSESGAKTWTIIAGVIFVISLLGPAGAPTTGAKVSLACIHLVAALILIPGLSRTARKG